MDVAIRSTIQQAVSENPVVLYMKGTRRQPQCGFSARVVEILDTLLPEYVTVDVISDPALRQDLPGEDRRRDHVRPARAPGP